MATDVSIRLGVNGEKEFGQALRGAESQIKNLKSEMKSMVSGFTDMDDAETRTAKQTDVLGRTMDATKQKVSILSAEYNRQKAVLNQLGAELDQLLNAQERDELAITKATNAYNRQMQEVNKLGTKLNNATTDLNRMEKEMRDLGSEADKAGDALEEMGSDADKTGASLRDAFVGGAVAGGIQSLISGISGLVDQTTDYRKIMGTLEVSSQKAGYSAEQTATSYRQLYGVIGDDQQSATALANLQALGVSQDQLTQFIDGAIGAWATYGDSIPIDSLAEAINETVQAGTVTGTFADVLNWAGTNEDEFNEKLAACKTESERANLVLQELADQGLIEAADGWRENNESIVDANEAQADMNEVMGDTAEKLSPLVTQIKEGLAGALETLQPALQFIIDNAPVIIAAIGGIAAGIIGMNFSSIIGMIAGIVSAIGGPVTLIVAAITGIVAAVITLWNTNEGFREAVLNIWENIKIAFQTAWEFIKSVWDQVKPYFQAIWDGIQTIFSTVVSVLGGFFSAAWSAIKVVWDAVVGFFSTVWDGIKAVFSVVQAVLSGDFSAAKEAIQNAWSGITSFFSDIWDKIKGVFSNAWEAFKGIGSDIVNGIKNGISSAWSAFTGWLSNKFSSIINIGKKVFDIGSPSKVFRDKIGLMITYGLAEGIEDGTPKAVKAVENMSDEVIKASETEISSPEVSSQDDGVYSGLVSAFAESDPLLFEYLDVLSERLNSYLTESVGETIEIILSLISSQQRTFRQAGKSIMDGVAQGVADGQSGVVNAIKRALQAAVAAAKAAMKIASPSKVFAEIGKYMGAGVGVGFEREMKIVNQDIAAAMLKPVSRISRDDMYNAAEATVNGMAANQTANMAQTIIIPVNLNGKQIAEVIFDPLRGVAKQRGVAFG